ncbi:MAG TPA: cytochrome c [Pyrinomonadaceae bacterium]|nr:cytochrome c [Pyrinomonadaceae bacterium]
MRKVLLAATLAAALCLVAASQRANATQDNKNANGASQTTDAAALYKKHCDTCHGKDGRAKTFKAKFNHARDLTDAQWQADVTDERLFNSISNGKGKMPSFKKKLTEPRIESLVVYVRGLKK